jgi:hypothetical protein
LNRFFQKAFQAAKEIRTRTEIGRGAVSIKSAAVELVGTIFEDDLAGRAIMVIGAGQMAESCVRLLVKRGVQSILISNRSLDLAMRWGGPAVTPPKGMPRPAFREHARNVYACHGGRLYRSLGGSRRIPLPMTCTA